MTSAAALLDHLAPRLLDGLSDLAGHYDVLLCDIWGVVHDGRAAFAPALDALRRVRHGGGTVVFITNAPRPRAPVLAQMRDLGVTPDAFDAIVTSGDVTVAAVAARADAAAHHIGPPRDLALFEAVRAQTGQVPRLTGVEDADYVVVTGLFDDETETPAHYADALAAMRRRGLPMICANPDIVVHIGNKLRYCGGALAEAYAALGGETILAGKPHAPIYRAALDEAARHSGRPIDRTRVLAVGDGLVTDVAGAAGQKLDMLFITTGIHRDDLHPEGDGLLDRLAYAERLARLAHRPLAAMPRLAW